MFILLDELEYLVLKYVNIIDLLTIKQVNKRLYNKVNIIIHNRICSNDILEQLVNTYNVNISGSYLLKQLTNDSFNPGDIDIYTHIKNKSGIQDLFIRNECVLVKKYNYYKSLAGIKEVINFSGIDSINDYQIIFMSDGVDLKEPIEHFDIDIVKNSYNGRELKLYNKEKIINKQLEFNLCCKKHIKRSLKYYDRGYTDCIDVKSICNPDLVLSHSEIESTKLYLDTRIDIFRRFLVRS